MKRFLYLILFLCLPMAHAETSPADITLLQEKIAKTVDVQTLESEERNEWTAKKAQMETLLELHKKELTLLDEELDISGQSAPAHSEEVDTLTTGVESFKKSRQLTKQAIARNVPRTLALAKHFPTPLQEQIRTEIDALESWTPGTESRDALRAILGIIDKAQKFNRSYTRSTEILNNREVEILYLGLARAFYTDRKSNSGFGTPSPKGWVWEPSPEVRDDLITALDSLDKKTPPAMVTLPLQIK